MTALADALDRMRARLAARPDTEHEQAIVRLVIGAAVLLYLLPGTADSLIITDSRIFSRRRSFVV